MEFRKNDLVTLEIEDCGIDGEGIGKADGFTVFALNELKAIEGVSRVRVVK